MTDTYLTIEPGILERPLKDSVREYEREVIHAALKAYGDDKRKVAKLLDISLSSLYRKISDIQTNGGDHEDVRESDKIGGNGNRYIHN
jgi:transcriptional regulator with PAS, ATPase and Fis domain